MEILSENKAVSLLAEIIALECGADTSKAKQVRTAASLHDVGKLKIPTSILNKKGKLESYEFEIIKTHTFLGADMLSGIQGEIGVMLRTVCMYHHEWYDGSKSYWGKNAADLPKYVPIITVCDVFAALMAKRPYKDPWPPDKVIEYIQEHSGTQFDPKLTALFISLLRHDERLSAIYLKETKY